MADEVVLSSEVGCIQDKLEVESIIERGRLRPGVGPPQRYKSPDASLTGLPGRWLGPQHRACGHWNRSEIGWRAAYAAAGFTAHRACDH